MLYLRSTASIRKDWEGFQPHDKFVNIAATHSPTATFQIVINMSGSVDTATKYQDLAFVRIHYGYDLFQEITGSKNVS